MTADKMQDHIRALNENDLERVIEIDAKHIDRPRRGFFEKRLSAALREPQNFVYVGYEDADGLEGFIIARILEGEFGRPKPIASMDAIGVDPRVPGKGIGQALIKGMESVLRDKNINEIQTQLDWTNFGLSTISFRLWFRADTTPCDRTIHRRRSRYGGRSYRGFWPACTRPGRLSINGRRRPAGACQDIEKDHRP